MNLFQDFIESHFRRVESRFPNVERRDSGPAHLDKTSDEYYASETTDDQYDAQDSLFGLKTLTPEQEQQLRGWE